MAVMVGRGRQGTVQGRAGVARALRWLAAGTAAALAVVLAVLGALAGPLPEAAAHPELLASDPDDLSQVARPPRQIRLTFFDAVEPRQATVTLSVEGSAPRRLASRIKGAEVFATVDVSPSGYNQQWYVAYEVVAYDGHPVTDVLSFVVAPDPSSPATPVPADASTTATQSPSTTGGRDLSRRDGTRPLDLPPAIPVAVVALAVAGSAALAARSRRRRRP